MPTVNLKGIKENPTLLADSLTRGTDEGKPVKVSANKTGALCSAEDPFYGTIESIAEDNAVCVVKNVGITTVGYTGTAPGLNKVELVGDGSGGVKTPTTPGTGKEYFILDVDTTNTEVTFDLG